MLNYTVSPQGLTFSTTTVQGPIPGLYATPQTLHFYLTNNTGTSLVITNYGFSDSTEGDAVTQPVGIYTNSDFTVAVHSSAFPVTITAGSTQEFDVTYAPLRRGNGFGDVRSAILAFFNGQKAITNGGQVLNSSGEVINFSVPVPVTVGVGGGVIEEGYDWPSTHPIMGMPVNFTLADMDTGHHAVSSIPLYSGTTAGSTSNSSGVQVGARGVQVLVSGLDTASYLDLTIYVVTTGGNVVVGTWTAALGTKLTYANVGALFLGNNEGLDLQGLPLYATVANFHNPNTTIITISVVVTG